MSEWRMLGPEDIFQEGDEWTEKGKKEWILVDPTSFGDHIGVWVRFYNFRRRVSPVAKNATTQEARCEECNGELSQCGPQGVDGEPTLGCKYCSLKEKLVEAEQRAEKAEDGLDLIYSASGQEHGTPDTVVAGIRHMRLKIDEFIAARQQAEKERDQLRAEFASYIETTDLILDEAKIPNRDGVGRAGPKVRVKWLCDRYAEEKAESEKLLKQRDEAEGLLFDKDQENERLREALEKIASHPFISYERAQGGIYEGQYGIGVVDGHRACSTIAQQALAAKACPHDSVNQGIHPDEGYMVVCKKCGEDLSPVKGETK